MHTRHYEDIDLASVSDWLRYEQHKLELELLQLKTSDLCEVTVPNYSDEAYLEPIACVPSFARYEQIEKRKRELESNAEYLHQLYVGVEHQLIVQSPEFNTDLELAEVS